MKLILTEKEYRLIEGIKDGFEKVNNQLEALENLGYDIPDNVYDKRNLLFLTKAISEFQNSEVFVQGSDGKTVKAKLYDNGSVEI